MPTAVNQSGRRLRLPAQEEGDTDRMASFVSQDLLGDTASFPGRSKDKLTDDAIVGAEAVEPEVPPRRAGGRQIVLFRPLVPASVAHEVVVQPFAVMLRIGTWVAITIFLESNRTLDRHARESVQSLHRDDDGDVVRVTPLVTVEVEPHAVPKLRGKEVAD